MPHCHRTVEPLVVNMKVRNGFVSNSSSSSFVIVYDNIDDNCPFCNRNSKVMIDVFFNHVATEPYGKTEIHAQNPDEIIKYFEKCKWTDDEDKKVIIEAMEKAKNDNCRAIYMDISYHDSTTDELLKVLPHK